MQLDERSLPVTRGQLIIWLVQETAQSGSEWRLGPFVRIEGAVEPDGLEWVINRVMQEAEPGRAAFFEVDGQPFQRALLGRGPVGYVTVIADVTVLEVLR
jgi:hypothetical protein